MRGAPTAILITLLMAGGVLSGGMMMRAGHAETAPDGFDAMMAQSMARMHADMAVPPSGDPDRDFAAMEADKQAEKDAQAAETQAKLAARGGDSFDPDQPRDEAGRWAAEAKSAAENARKAAIAAATAAR